MKSSSIRITPQISARHALLLSAALACSAAAAPVYHAVYLGGGDFLNYASLNKNGEFAMAVYNATDSKDRAVVATTAPLARELSFLYDASGTPLWTGATTGFSSKAYDISDSGVVVGTAASGTTSSSLFYDNEAFRTGNGRVEILTSPSAATLGMTSRLGSVALSVNNSGETVGYGYGSGARAYGPLFWSGAGSATLLPLPGGVSTDSKAQAISDAGVIVGWYKVGANSNALIWNNQVPTNLGTLGGLNSEAYDVNSSWVVGYAQDNGGHDQAFRRPTSGGALQALTPLSGATSSHAYSVNSSGVIAGDSGNHAVVWDASGTVQKLEDLDDSQEAMTSAIAVNDRGYVLTMDGLGHLWILRPVGWAGSWKPLLMSVGWDTPKVIWYRPDNFQIGYWNATSTAGYASSGFMTTYPYNWLMSSMVTNANSTSFILWNGTHDSNLGADNRGKIAIWALNSAGILTWSREITVDSQFSAVSLAADPVTGGYRIIFRRTSDGALVVWRCDSAGNIITSAWLTPPTGWVLWNFKVGADGKGWLLWQHTATKKTALWRTSNDGVYEGGAEYGPITDFDPKFLTLSNSTSASEPYIWWVRKSDGIVAAWHCTNSGAISSTIWAPSAPGWTLIGGQSSFSSNRHVLFWTDQNNQLGVWNLDANGVFQTGGVSGIIGTD